MEYPAQRRRFLQQPRKLGSQPRHAGFGGVIFRSLLGAGGLEVGQVAAESGRFGQREGCSMTLAARIDPNQPAIAAALTAAGCSVEYLHAVGRGCPDLLVGMRGRTYLLEVKLPGKTLNERQEEWHAGWRGHVAIVTTAAEALAAVGLVP